MCYGMAKYFEWIPEPILRMLAEALIDKIMIQRTRDRIASNKFTSGCEHAFNSRLLLFYFKNLNFIYSKHMHL